MKKACKKTQSEMEITDSNEKFIGRYFCLTFVKTRGLEKMGKR